MEIEELVTMLTDIQGKYSVLSKTECIQLMRLLIEVNRSGK